jgi:hypothetical protein
MLYVTRVTYFSSFQSNVCIRAFKLLTFENVMSYGRAKCSFFYVSLDHQYFDLIFESGQKNETSDVLVTRWQNICHVGKGLESRHLRERRP